tara:strand:+ start:23 stop:325 length:303 start_codon:yes stop_codon:yes gene_type:complete
MKRRNLNIDENMKELMINVYISRGMTEQEANEAFDNQMWNFGDAERVFFHGYLDTNEFSKEEFKMLPKPILSLIGWMVKELESTDKFREELESWFEDRPF